MAEFPPASPTTERRPAVSLDPAHAARLSQAVMRKQAALSVRVAGVFLLLIFCLPLVNWLLPGVANAPLGGFTLTWLILGVLFYPVTWLLSGYFIRESDRLESEIAREGLGVTESIGGDTNR